MSDPTPAEKEYYYADADAKPVGPQTAEKLRDLRHRGILTDETLVIETAGTAWVAYRTLGKAVTLPPIPVPAKGSFLVLKRTFTALVLFVVLTVVVDLVATVVGCALAGGLDSVFHPGGDFTSGYERGKEVGAAFTRQYGGTIFIGSLFASMIGALALSFSNVLPWCRRSQAHRLAKR
jgi:hypothetical protein